MLQTAVWLCYIISKTVCALCHLQTDHSTAITPPSPYVATSSMFQLPHRERQMTISSLFWLWTQNNQSNNVCRIAAHEWNNISRILASCHFGFLPTRRYASMVCLSVRPSHAGIVPSRAKAGSWNVHHLIAPWFYFLARYESSKNSQGVIPKERAKWESVGFFGNFRPICRHISKTVNFRQKVTIGW